MEYKGAVYTVYDEVRHKMSDLLNNQVPYVEVEIKTKRNPHFHAKFFKFLSYVAEYTDQNLEAVRDIVTIKAGHYDAYPINENYVYYKPKSISFAKMDEEQFKEFYEKAISSAMALWGFDRQQLEKLNEF